MSFGINRLCMTACALLLAACGTAPPTDLELVRLARRADTSYQTGRLDQAKKQYEALLKENPAFATAYVRLGAIAYREGDSAAAKRRFEEAIARDPANSQAKYNLAMLNLNEASRLLEDYVELSPSAANRDHVAALLVEIKEFGLRR